MADTSVDERSMTGSGSPDAQAEALADAYERVGEENYDPELHWTAQQGPMPPEEIDPALLPQHYLKEQLPDPEGAQNALLPELDFPEELIIEDAGDDPQGPEPDELLSLGKISAMPEREVVETANTQEELAEGWTVQNPDWTPEADGAAAPAAPEGEEEVDLDTMTKAEIQAWADANGYEDVVNKDTMTKDEMIEAITG